ncbi:MAG: mannose-1-phosphate guanylyltransferase/mannose-6-phosphate isomerase [Archaeoglobaceae archaeon]|nr:mannose-1-phosphate guanylyltransferase/mannose-6-phosphate isomerase [Archaeoglobaceae archaeon]MCX8151873.1 mannose-1-phosphate guanylyltransferase/mannose-6-phosphate isomerase [Archaeoglobaceae archaeon]MDW8014295.1 mannose-1-phosphate guanylyltransferase/mannose-6-phosphate isomerase [Archaeoglobaceae archaeon]
MKVVILAGGKGTRLWPLSRESMPKQFLKIFGESLFQKTVKRATLLSDLKDIFVVTNKEYRFRVLDDLEEIGLKIPEENVILEPKAKSTLPAICLAMKIAGDGKFAVLPSDQVVGVNEKYLKAFKTAEVLSDRFLITFGIKPRKPHTGYGYIKPGEKIFAGEVEAFKVDNFKEKPKKEVAEEFLKMGYLWNSGMFLFDKKNFVEELKKHLPEMLKVLEDGEKAYDEVQEISVDHGLLERSDKVAVVPMEVEWSDVGSFDSIYDQFQKDGNENVFLGEVLSLNSRRNLAMTEKLAVLLDVEDLILIDTEDALLVAKRGNAEKVKKIYEILKERKDKRVEIHRIAYRPWGSYLLLEERNGYKIKKIVVRPGKRLSLQRHYHRSEHWIVVSGTARILVDGREVLLRKGESTFVPAGSLHRIENPGKIPLEIIEVQIGEYLEEDDIERFEDDYGRC